MGLDFVELILAIEDAFQIHFADEEANKLAIVGDLQNLVVHKLPAFGKTKCLTSAAF
jgi:acyl carrier protein